MSSGMFVFLIHGPDFEFPCVGARGALSSSKGQPSQSGPKFASLALSQSCKSEEGNEGNTARAPAGTTVIQSIMGSDAFTAFISMSDA